MLENSGPPSDGRFGIDKACVYSTVAQTQSFRMGKNGSTINRYLFGGELPPKKSEYAGQLEVIIPRKCVVENEPQNYNPSY